MQTRDRQTEEESLFGKSGVDLVIAGASHVGQVRELNEDSLLIMQVSTIHEGVTRPIALAAVADGMGGHEGGEVASRLALTHLAKDFIDEVLTRCFSAEGLPPEDPWYAELLQRAVRTMDEVVTSAGKAAGANMGTTLTGALVVGSVAHLVNIGDSRAYRIIGDRVEPLTQDHSLVADLVRSGEITPEEVYTHPQRNVIMRFIGDGKAESDTFTHMLRPGETLLLCTDGLWEMVHDDDLADIVGSSRNPYEAVQKLIQAANRAGGQDNIAVVVIRAYPSA
jgi:serine/threonine protein phosphatase PrpC